MVSGVPMKKMPAAPPPTKSSTMKPPVRQVPLHRGLAPTPPRNPKKK